MSNVSVRFLGCGDAFGSGGRYNTCFYVEAPSARFLIDCGASSLVAMKRFGINPARIDFVLLTHFHGDHFAGIPFLAMEARIFRQRQSPLVIAGPRDVQARVGQAIESAFPGSQSLSLEFIELSDERPTPVGSLAVHAFPVIHSEATNPHALRIQCDGKVIAYSGDTEWTDSLIQVADGADLFICESYFFEKAIPKHLSYTTLRKHRAELRCRRLILTHMHDDMLGRLAEAEMEFAEDGKQLVL